MFFFPVGIWAAVMVYRARKRSRDATLWPATSGVIIKSMFIKGGRTGDMAIVAYHYYTPEERFGSGLGPDGLLVANPMLIVKRFPVGQKVRVRYNPKRPEVSFLDSGALVQTRELTVLAVIGISSPLVMFLWSLWWE